MYLINSLYMVYQKLCYIHLIASKLLQIYCSLGFSLLISIIFFQVLFFKFLRDLYDFFGQDSQFNCLLFQFV